MLVGRDAEVGIVREVLGDAFGGRGRVLWVEGEAGIGKSAVLDAAAGEARARGGLVVVARCQELDQARPFGPLLDADRRDDAAGLVAALEAPVLRMAAERAAPLEIGPEVRSLLVERAVSALEARCLREPVVLCLDDAHWADGATLLTLGSLARRCTDLPLALVLASRPPLGRPEVEAFLQGIESGAAPGRPLGLVRLDLQPLADDHVAAVTEQLAGAPPGPALARLLDRCDGNPLLVVETVTALRDGDGLAVTEFADLVPGAGERLGTSLATAVGSRMARLEGDERSVAAVAALLGARFTMGDLAAALGRRPADLLHVIRVLVEAHLFVDEGSALAFRHDLVREVVAASLPASVRAELHQVIATALRDAGAPVTRVAEHVALGAPDGSAEAIDALRGAAAEVASQDPTAAARLLGLALERVSPTDPSRDEVLAELVDALAWSGRIAESQAMADEVLTRPVPPAVEERLRSALGRSLLLLGRPQEAVTHEERLISLQEALGRSPAWALAECAMCKLFGLDLDGALADAVAGVTAAEADGDVMANILALCVQAFAHNALGDSASAAERADRAVALADTTPGGEGHRLHPNLFRGITRQTLGDHDAAAAALRLGRAQGEALGASWALPIYHFATGLAHWDAGRWDDLLAEVDAGVALGDEKRSTIAQVWAYAVAARVHVHRGDLDRAEAMLDRGDEVLAAGGLQYGIDWLVLSRALLLEARGHRADALATLVFGWETAVGLQAFASLALFGPDLTRLALAEGDGATAAKAAAELAAAADARPGDRVLAGRSRRSRGLVDDDAALLCSAVEDFAALGHPFEAAITRVDAARALHAAGRHDECVAELRSAVPMLEGCGAVAEAEAVRALLAAWAGAPRRPAPTRPVSGWGALTPTEREVVEEVCTGRSNTEVADRLGVSRRTVEAHLRSVYTKLGVPTRLALAVAHRERAGRAAPLRR